MDKPAVSRICPFTSKLRQNPPFFFDNAKQVVVNPIQSFENQFTESRSPLHLWDYTNYLGKAFDAWLLLFNLMLSFPACSAFMH